MEEVLLIVLRLLFTILWGVLEGLSYWPFDFGYERASDRLPRWLILLCYFLLGCGVGGISIVLMPHIWLPSSNLRVANLIVAPIIAGSIGVFSARHFYKGRSDVNPQDHFLPGFLFAFAVAAIRFVYIKRTV